MRGALLRRDDRRVPRNDHPVLVTPAHDAVANLDEARKKLHHVLVPLDFMGATSPQLDVARAIADGLGTTRCSPTWWSRCGSDGRAAACVHEGTDRERRQQRTSSSMPPVRRHRTGKVELLTAFGDPAEEIAKIAADRNVGLVVMGLHASPRHGPRMGSVTYRVLCLVPTLVLALPPSDLSAAKAKFAAASTSAIGS